MERYIDVFRSGLIVSKSTAIELVQELEKLPQYKEIQFLIREARAFEFHDYKNKKYACGKVAVAGYLDAFALKYPDIASDLKRLSGEVKDGEYDETADEEDVAALRGMIDEDKSMEQHQKSKLKEMLGLTKEQNRKSPWGKSYFS